MTVASVLAHSTNSYGEEHVLADHLQHTGEVTAAFAGWWGASEVGWLAGALHDLGKADPEFQRYLAGDLTRSPGVGHAAAGALALFDLGQLDAALAVLAHHSGLADRSPVRDRLERARLDPGTTSSLGVIGDLVGESWRQSDIEVPSCFPASCDLLGQRRLWTGNDLAARWLLSALVDADRLDTEAHFDRRQSAERSSGVAITDVAARFADRRTEVIAARDDDPASDVRRLLRDTVLERLGEAPVGLYTLTAPTGSGKTQTVLEAALRHAQTHGLRRVVMAAPFTSVVSQTAAVMRLLMDDDGDAVLEHHSNVDDSGGSDGDDQRGRGLRRRLATENWDRPIIATTSVQLLETLFSNRPSKLRKLHRLAGSVIIVDEVQSIPWDLLNASVRMLAQVSEVFGATVVLCTATQPPISLLSSTRDRSVVELAVGLPAQLVGTRLVRCEVIEDACEWDEIVELLTNQAELHGGQGLAVVNTIGDAEGLFDLLSGTAGVTLLTTRLCPAHRRDQLRRIHARLVGGQPVVVVSTQLIEAGVDIDFPVGLRVLAPLPAIVQTAGRVNRHGLRPQSSLFVVSPTDGKFPPGEYRSGAQVTQQLIQRGMDLLEPSTTDRYYRLMLDLVGEPKVSQQIDAARANRDFGMVAGRFHLIADDTVGVVCAYDGFDPESLALPAESTAWQQRNSVRFAAPYTVSIRRRDFEDALAIGMTRPIAGTPLHAWLGDYRDRAGLALPSTRSSEML